MTSKYFFSILLFIGSLSVFFAEAQNANVKNVINIYPSNTNISDSTELEVLLRDTNVIVILRNADSTILVSTDLPPIIRDIAFKIAGLDEVLSQYKQLDELDKDIIYEYSRRKNYKLLQGKYIFMRYELSVELNKVSKRIIYY